MPFGKAGEIADVTSEFVLFQIQIMDAAVAALNARYVEFFHRGHVLDHF